MSRHSQNVCDYSRVLFRIVAESAVQQKMFLSFFVQSGVVYDDHLLFLAKYPRVFTIPS